MEANTFSLSSIFDSSATYQIRILGKLDSRWSDWTEGMQINPDETDGQNPTTVLVGDIPDQAALLGILNTIYNHHYPLISVMRLASAE